MKRTRQKNEDKKGYKFDLSEVYEVTFKKKTKYHEAGEKTLVSLPIAIKFVNDGRIELTPEVREAAEKAGMTELINIKIGK